MDITNLKENILQILSLYKGQKLTAGKIMRLLPKGTAKKELVLHVLSKLGSESLIETSEGNLSVTITPSGTNKRNVEILDAGEKTFSIKKSTDGQAEKVNITHTVYSITEKGIEAAKKYCVN